MFALWGSSKVDESVRKRALMTGVLDDIIDQRSKLKLDFDEGVTTLKNISANILRYDANGVILEVSALKGTSDTWVGVGVSCFFRILDRENRNHTQFLTFHTQILSVHVRPNGLVYFVLNIPETFKLSQQRRCVRVGVDQSRVPVFSLWRELSPKAIVANITPTISSTAHAFNNFKLGNISTTGLLLQIQNALIREVMPEYNVGEKFSFHFEVVSEPDTPAESFFVNAVLRNTFSDPQDSVTSLGFEFISEGAIDDEGRLSWLPLKSDEVGSLGTYVLKWNLMDFHRDKRIEAA